MLLLAWRHVAAMLAIWVLLASALAAPTFTRGGDGAFRNITAIGGALPGVDVSGALVQSNGSSTTMAALALEAANAVPLAMAGQPNGWLKLDVNGLVPATALPANALSGIDPIARSTAAAASAAAAAALPASAADRAGGFAQLDGNALVPLTLLPSSVTSPTDPTARSTAGAAQSAANAAQSAANAAQALAASAMPSSLANKAGGFAQLDTNALVPLALLPPSVASPTDATARTQAAAAQSAASAAQTLAAGAVPANVAGKAGGFAQLDSNALVPVVNLPAAYNAASALAASTLGQANGPAQLDAGKSLSGNMVAATAGAVQRSLAAHFADVVDAADYGMKCDYQTLGDLTTTQGSVVVSSASYVFTQNDVGRHFAGGYELGQTQTTIASVNANGSANLATPATATRQPTAASGSTPASPATGYANLWTDDTSAFKTAVGVAQGRLGGADLVLPGGQCELSAEIDVADTTSLRIRGAGIEATRLDWMTPTNGLIVTETNQASLTVGDFMMSKHLGTNGSTVFIGTALSIGGAFNQTGENKIGDVTIIGSSFSGQIDGWNQGLVETNLSHSYTAHVTVLQPGAPIPASYPAPGTTVSSLTASPFGSAADIVLQGTNGGYYIDGALDSLTTTGGNVSLDLAGLQGAYITNSRLTYANYGIRADTVGTTSELLNLSNSYVIANVIDLYLNGVGDNQVTGNMFWPNSGAVTSWVGAWLRNTDSDEMTGNGFLGHIGVATVTDYGSYVSWDGGGGYAHSITGNTFYNIHGTAISNAAQTGGITAVGNTIIGATIATSDPVYGETNGTGNAPAVPTNGMGNTYFANLLNGLTAMSDDGNRNIQFAKNLTCGNLYDSCTFKVIGTSDGTSFSVDPSGNAVAGLSVRTPTLVTGSAASHRTIQADLGVFASGTATLTMDGTAPGSTNILPALPNATTTGSLAVYGEASCQNGVASVETFRFSGIWVQSSTGVLSVKTFNATENDGQATPPAGWGMQGAVDTSGSRPLLQMTGLSATTDCSAHAFETVVQ